MDPFDYGFGVFSPAHDLQTWKEYPYVRNQAQRSFDHHADRRTARLSRWSSGSGHTCVSFSQCHTTQVQSTPWLASSRSSITIAEPVPATPVVRISRTQEAKYIAKSKSSTSLHWRKSLKSLTSASLRDLARQLLSQENSEVPELPAAAQNLGASKWKLNVDKAETSVGLPHTLPEHTINWPECSPHITLKPGQRLDIEHCCYGTRDTYDIVRSSGIELVRRIHNPTSKSSAATTSSLQQDAIKLAELQHSHIVQLIGSYQTPSVVAFLSFPVADMDLAYYLQQSAAPVLEARQKLSDLPCGSTSLLWSHDVKSFLSNISLCMVSAVRYVHAQNLVHGNIKTSNFLLRAVTPSPWPASETSLPPFKVYLTDFAVGISDGAQPFFSDGYKHTYTAPEVLRGETFEQPADIYSLGCVFAEMSVVSNDLRLPLVSTSPSAKRLSVEFPEHPEAYAAHLPGLYRVLSSLKEENQMVVDTQTITQMLHRDPRSRPQLFPSETYGFGVLCLECEHDHDGPDELEVFD